MFPQCFAALLFFELFNSALSVAWSVEATGGPDRTLLVSVHFRALLFGCSDRI